MPGFGESGGRGAFSLMRPARAFAAGADVIAGYVIASPAAPREADALAVVPLLFASGWLLSAAGSVFAAAFRAGKRDLNRDGQDERDVRRFPSCPSSASLLDSAQGRTTLKRVFLAGAALSLAGVFAAMGAALSAGKLPAYFAAFIFLVNWARAGTASPLGRQGTAWRTWGLRGAVCASAGLARALMLGLGMSAHGEIVYLTDARPVVAAVLLFALGALVEAVDDACGEGGRRYFLLASLAGLLGVLVVPCIVLRPGPVSWIVGPVVGGVFLVARGMPAVRSLVPADVRRFAEGALLAGFFLDSALCFARGGTGTGTITATLALGIAPLVLLVPAAAALSSAEGPRGRTSQATPGYGEDAYD